MNSEIFLNIEYRNLYILPLGLTVDVLSWLQKNPEQGAYNRRLRQAANTGMRVFYTHNRGRQSPCPGRD